MWGSSAGGHLAGSFGTQTMGYVKYGLPKPAALILTYPVVTMTERTHIGTRVNLLGMNPSEKMIRLTSIEQQITENYPPTFLWCGDCDRTVDPENSRMLECALRKKNVPCLRREYAGIDHGVGLGQGLACQSWFEDAIAFWEANRRP